MLEKKRLFKVVFGTEEGYEEQPVYDHLSQLRKLLEDFLAQIDFESNEHERNRHLLNSLASRKQPDQFNRIADRSEKELSRAGKGQRHYSLNRFLLLEQRASHLQRARKRRADEKHEELMREMVAELDRHYLASKLMLSCEMLNRSKIVKGNYPFPLLEELQQFLAQPDHYYRDTAVIQLYYTISRMLTEEESTPDFEELVRLLDSESEALSLSEAHTAYAFAQNYCIRRINKGDGDYLRKLFELYQQMLERKIIIESDGFLAHWNYKNIATLGLRLGAFDWVHSFNEKYREHLSPDYRENAYNYNLAAYYYETKAYKSAMKLLQQVEFTDIYYHLTAKSMLLKIYFDLEEEDSLSYLILAFKALLRRNRHIADAQMKLYTNLLNYVRQAQRLRSRQQTTDPARFKQQVEDLLERIDTADGGVANAKWLKEKVHALAPESMAVEK